ncbi:MAG: TrkH family potassium uptake protein [Anaerovoracaceae bacterium]|jgi:trk system potassium uptake protein TrkH
MVFNYRQIIRILSYTLMIPAVFMVLPLLISLYDREYPCTVAFLVPMAITIILSLTTLIKVHLPISSLDIREAFLTVFLCWIGISLLGSIPFILSGHFSGFTDAFFESCSAFTCTGASILTDVEGMAKSLILWRSLAQWLGGIGILIFSIAVFPSLGINGVNIATGEISGSTAYKVNQPVKQHIRNLCLIYSAFTLMQVLLLMAGGVGIFDSLILTLSTGGTGGFTNYNSGIPYINGYLTTVLCIFMILAATNYSLYNQALKNQKRNFFKDIELRAFLLIIIVASSITVGLLMLNNTYDTLTSSINHGVFQVVSSITTGGFTITDINLWPTTCKIILFILMVSGGCTGSTGGGIKIIRLIILFKLIRRGIYKRLHPNAVVGIKLGIKPLSSDMVSFVANYLFLYLTVFITGSLMICFYGTDLETSLSACLACLSNVGYGFNLVGPMETFAFFPGAIKVLLSFIMIAGRLELFAFFMLFVPSFWNPHRR